MVTQEQMVPVRETPTGVRLQTFARCYEQIQAGESPWLPLGNMMHQFFGSLKHLRADLVADPIEMPTDVSPELWHWAVFCAASVEYLCRAYEIPCPIWALDQRFQLAEPWFYGIGAELERVREKLCQTTPEEFARRNIFCGNRIYANKYEYKGRKTA